MYRETDEGFRIPLESTIPAWLHERLILQDVILSSC